MRGWAPSSSGWAPSSSGIQAYAVRKGDSQWLGWNESCQGVFSSSTAAQREVSKRFIFGRHISTTFLVFHLRTGDLRVLRRPVRVNYQLWVGSPSGSCLLPGISISTLLRLPPTGVSSRWVCRDLVNRNFWCSCLVLGRWECYEAQSIAQTGKPSRHMPHS